MRNQIYFIIVLTLLQETMAQSTDFQWWNERHGWDGISPYEKYMHIEPGRMGPNALPVPDLVFFVWDSLNYLKGNVQTYFAPGDFTFSGGWQVYYQADRRVAISAHMVYAEFFKTSVSVRDFRVARTFDARGWAVGDLYVETHWLMVRSRRWIPEVILRSGIKTASGNRLEDARFSDTPGYYFDLNFRKVFKKNFIVHQWYSMMGFYAYQTYRVDYKQNDALLYGVGWRFQTRTIGLDTHLRGYAGYFGKYDKPLIFSFSFFRQLESYLLSVRFQRGNHSWPFWSAELGFVYRFF
ncbi:hypothetical protein [Schleiferia thermophila]|uniref:hypothetical protein n=1 Tax=Schleiferia thermophila TaxID=884107 RepID=UPI002FD9ADF7